ncbi:MAG TPA: endonuclease [Elusimicrobia bacterium]|nr:endonuclease [Elusimicrobiota bacterium]HCE97724.1 endonuclease [Elusimicrobiota bacterium]
MYIVYVLLDRYNRLYIGSTGNFDRRFKEHSSGTNKSTRGREPFRVFLTESYLTRPEAVRREKALKGGQGRAWLKKVLGV